MSTTTHPVSRAMAAAMLAGICSAAWAGPGINYGEAAQGAVKPQASETFTFQAPQGPKGTISVGSLEASPMQPTASASASASSTGGLPGPVVLYNSMKQAKQAQDMQSRLRAQASVPANAQPTKGSSTPGWLQRLESLVIMVVFFGVLIVLGISRAKNRSKPEKE